MTRVTYHNLYAPGRDDEGFGSHFEAALSEARASVGDPCPHLIGGERVGVGSVLEREDPSRCNEVISGCFEAGGEMVDSAIAAARAAAPEWARLSTAARAEQLLPALELVEQQKVELAALLSLETGKPRVEALGEVEEVVELVRLYCGIAADPGRFVDEIESSSGSVRVRSFLRPYGVFGVIVPFNFPMALPVNMALPALLAGNTVVVKASHLAPRSAAAVADIFDALEIPAGVFNLVHGGDESGAALVNGDIDGIAFTGSAEVGLSILRKLQAGPYPKPVIAEMGGKNPAVVTASADLAAAASAVTKSAFGMSGQKCSSCSRVIVLEEAHDELLELLRQGAASLKFGDPVEPDSFAGPVIDEGAVERFEASVARAREDGRLVAGGERVDDGGYFVSPTVVAGLPQGHDLTRDELFLPFLTVTAVPDVESAIAEANAVPFGLTAGIFTADEDEIAQFLERVEAGCTFSNHAPGATTGVWPGVQTFGGWKASGTSGKHGFGSFYLQQFMRQQCQTVSIA